MNLQLLALNRQEVVDLLVVDLHVGHPDEELTVVGLTNRPKPNKSLACIRNNRSNQSNN